MGVHETESMGKAPVIIGFNRTSVPKPTKIRGIGTESTISAKRTVMGGGCEIETLNVSEQPVICSVMVIKWSSANTGT